MAFRISRGSRPRVPTGCPSLRAAALLPALIAALTGCVTVIRPPANPPDPVVAALVDYGYHSSLVLPSADGESTEYAYGEWEWFALNHDDSYRVFPALCWPTRGTMGRRRLPVPTQPEALRPLVACEEMFALRVSRARAQALLDTLEARYQRHAPTEVYNPLSGLHFVQDDEDYSCCNNCNHVLVRWLEALGCEVRGTACFSSFKVEPPRDEP